MRNELINDLKPIKGCPPDGAGKLTAAILKFMCPKVWESLPPTQDPNVRHCGWCNQEIELVDQFDDLAKLWKEKKRHCVAIRAEDITVMGSHRYRGG